MFFSSDLLSRKTPLGRIWLAAWKPRMSKKQVQEIEVVSGCDAILKSPVPLSLRTSGILMGGVVKVHGMQTAIFHEDVTAFMTNLTRGDGAADAGESVHDRGKKSLSASARRRTPAAGLGARIRERELVAAAGMGRGRPNGARGGEGSRIR